MHAVAIDFGGKITPYLETLAALLSRKTGKRVKMMMGRAEDFEGTGPTPGTYTRVRIGATKDGKIVAGELYNAFEAGAYLGSRKSRLNFVRGLSGTSATLSARNGYAQM